MRRIVSVCLLSLLVAATLAACGPAGRTTAAVPNAPSGSNPSTAAAAKTTRSTPPPPDAITFLRSQGKRVVETSVTAKVDTATAIGKASFLRVDSTPTVITATKARITDSESHDRLVWVIGVSPVLRRSHGPGQSVPLPGRAAVVVDANTGAFVEMLEGPFMTTP